MKFFAPPLDSQWRLKDDWTPPTSFTDRHDNVEFVANITGDVSHTNWLAITGDSTSDFRRTDGKPTWVERYRQWRVNQLMLADLVVLPKGTVIVLDRYHASHSGVQAITARLLASPDQRLHPRKLGGKGKGKMRFYMILSELNSLPDMEEIDGNLLQG